jgi:hypothetical protein
MTALRYLGQTAAYAAFALVVGYFANHPAFTHFPPDQALIRLSFVHGAKREAECRRLTAEELARLPSTKRNPLDCPRGRLPLYVELDIDGRPAYRATLAPTGLWGDSPARVHEGFRVQPGPHRIAVRMRDTARREGFDHQREAEVVIAAGRNFVIDFRPGGDGFVFR